MQVVLFGERGRKSNYKRLFAAPDAKCAVYIARKLAREQGLRNWLLYTVDGLVLVDSWRNAMTEKAT